ncbi:sulfite exporter TauE/SafE family protein, partial [Mesorhizobium sp. M7A.F.Ca.CA.004.01.1.1]
PLGAKLAHALNPRYLKLAFAFFLAITAGRMLLS